jgi:hypothetical protein
MNAPAHRGLDIPAIDTTIQPTWTVKPLDSHFQSLGEVLFSWLNSDGYEPRNDHHFDGTLVRACCEALGLPCISVETEKLLGTSQYFATDEWIFDYLDAKGFHRMGHGEFYRLDEHYRPVMFVSLYGHTDHNIVISSQGAEHLVLDLFAEIKKHVKTDEKVEKKTSYAEIVPERGGMLSGIGGGGGLTVATRKIENPRIAQPEYYPYIDGGIEALLRDFIESEETVLILMGAPGTGKSSAIAAGVDALGLLPIYAKKAEVILSKDFVSYVFGASDTYMAKVAGTAARARSDLFTQRTVENREYAHRKAFLKDSNEEETRIPVIVVEDADALLAPRSTGNLIMSELLNETDGIGSNHTRKIIFTTNLSNTKAIDEALMRPGRCYGVIDFRLLSPQEAGAARSANGLPEFETVPTQDVSLAEALRKPRKRISISNGKARLGFTG